MKKREEPKVYSFCDEETFFETTNKGLAVVLFEEVKKINDDKFDAQLDRMREELENEE